MTPSSWEQIREAVHTFVNAQTPAESKQIVENYSNLLLTEAANEVLVNLLEQGKDNEDTVRVFEDRRRLLTRCRHEGIDAAFADGPVHSPATPHQGELDALLEELEELQRVVRPGDMPRVVSVCREALELVSRYDQPEVWAALQGQLGSSLARNPLIDRTQALEEAIYHYEQALEVYTRRDLPERWASVQNNLGIVYKNRIREDRAENLEKAIYHGQQALEVYTRRDLPERWADTQNNLANAYRVRIRGDRAENLEKAMYHYRQVLEVHTRQDFLQDWAMAQNNLAIAYQHRIRGERSKNLEKATYHYEQALEVFADQQDFPDRGATIQNNLASVYVDRILGDRAENLEKAIYHYEQALGVYTREAFRERWAAIQNNLANAYRVRIRGDRAENLEWAIHHCERALEVRTRQAFPVNWAITQNDLANAYRDRIRGNRTQNLEQAIHHYGQALEIRTVRAFPQDCRDTAYALGNLLYDERRFDEARTKFTIAHEAVEALRGEIQREGARRDLAEDNAILYARLVHCCLLGDGEEVAFEYAAAGKGRAFVDLLATARFDLWAAETDERVLVDSPELAADLRRARLLRQQIGDLLAQLSTNAGPSGPSSIPAAKREKMRIDLRARQDEYDALWEEMTFKYPALTATQRAPAFTADEARGLVADLGATLVEYYEHADGWCAFVVTPGEMRRVPLPDVNDELFDQMSKWLEWLGSSVGLGPLSYGPLRRLHEILIEPLRSYLSPGGVVVMAPFGKLHLLPLGAALDPTSGRYAAEDYKLSFAPSLAALRVTLEQARRKKDGLVDEQPARSLLGVAYPGVPGADRYLPNALPEAEAVASHFDGVTQLYQEAATPDAVLEHARGQDVIHFACHGSFDSEVPERSGLELSGGYLTMQRIITELRLDRSRLATLSACESGQVEVRQAEEHVGLVQAMMSAGAQAVVAGLWEVDDAATQALFERFYEGITAGASPADALGEAASEVREQPGWEHPYYWAAFQASGLAYGMNGSENVLSDGGGSS